MDALRAGRPLAWHLAVLCLALVVPILLLAAVLSWFFVEAERNRLEQEALGAVHDVVAATDRELAGLTATTEVLALSSFLQTGDLDAFDAQARQALSRLGTNVVVRDLSSQQVVNTRLPRGAPLPKNVDAESDRIAMQTKRPYVSDLFIGGVTRSPLFMINVPVLREDEVIYFLNLSLPPERIRDVILATNPPSGWNVSVTDRKGAVVGTSRGTMAPGQPLAPEIWAEIDGREGVLGERIVDGEPVLVAYHRSQVSGWVAVATVPEALLNEPLRHSLATLAFIAAAVPVLAAGLALWFSRRIEQPVGTLAFEAARLGRGELVRPLLTQVREVNIVGAALAAASRQRSDAEAALRDSEERYKTLSSSTREGVAIHDTRRIVEANDAFWTMFGYAEREAVVRRRPLAFVAPPARRIAAAHMRRGTDDPFESVGLRPDGTTFPIEVCCKPILHRGRRVHVAVVRDMTAHKAAEAALREGEARLQLAQAAGGVGTWDWDIVRGTTMCSEAYCRLYGLDPAGEGHGSSEAWLAQVHPDDREAVLRTRDAALSTGRLENEYRIVRPDGTMRRIIDRAVALFDEAGRPVRLLGANVDVTDAREAEERLRELQSQLLQASRLSAMGEMAATLAHELNQPLGAATNFLNAARLAIRSLDPEAPARAQARIEKAAEQTMRAGAILRRLREFIGRGEIDKQIASAQRLVEEAVSLALIGVHDPSLKLRYAFHEPDTKVLVDAIQVQQVVFNLVRNALDATEGRHPREIELSTRLSGEDKVEIAVADTGPGLPADPETLFRPFSTTKAHGLGLGLSICRAIVEAHGGRLWGETGPHGGAMFRFTVAAAPTGGNADE